MPPNQTLSNNVSKKERIREVEFIVTSKNDVQTDRVVGSVSVRSIGNTWTFCDWKSPSFYMVCVDPQTLVRWITQGRWGVLVQLLFSTTLLFDMHYKIYVFVATIQASPFQTSFDKLLTLKNITVYHSCRCLGNERVAVFVISRGVRRRRGSHLLLWVRFKCQFVRWSI